VSLVNRATALEIRPYRDTDEAGVLDLLSLTLGGGPAGRRPPEFFRWKHLESPFGPSHMLVAEVDGRIVGLRAFMRWRFLAGEREVAAVRAVDTATHPEHQGRGIFSRLTRQAVGDLRDEVDLVFNTPNEKSLPGYLKMGWTVVGRLHVDVRVRRPLSVARELRHLRITAEPGRPRPDVRAERAAHALGDPGLTRLLSAASEGSGRSLVTPRNAEFLTWRYGSAPLLDYRAVRQHAGGELVGIALFRVRPRGRLWETSVAEAIVRPGDARSARRLLAAVVHAAPVDHVACRFPAMSAAARGARRNGAVRGPWGVTLIANPLREIRPDPLRIGSWGVSLGDLEVF